ncbi:hypothetical protein [Methylomagnum ishizawai]|uniref:hypothetical protein n=1 Tax=Methylomagnum ishizawai TaxID=1760988 RepID=UPI001C32BF4C|nr:hypothetical protein [Methylomagnum ishizawai]BBL75005.1 hypothetical protein MishRS11D_21030 [Methylomagnum ishizawai]
MNPEDSETRPSRYRVAVVLGLVFALALLVRLGLLDGKPVFTPDSNYFFIHAENLLKNQCYSISAPDSKACQPSWGSQPPGYPLLIATVGLLGGGILQIAQIQTLVFALVVVYALWMGYRWHRSPRLLFIAGIVLAGSPVTVGWSRWVLTETLAAAGSLWVFAEIYGSLAERRLRTWRLAVALGCAIAMRWDSIWLLIPACASGFYLSGWRAGVGRAVLLLLAATLVPGIMAIRAWRVGLPLLPSVIADPGLSPAVVGFWRSAALAQNATSGFLWPVWGKHYSRLGKHWDGTSIDPALNTDEFKDILRRLGALDDGASLPKEIESDLQRLVDSRGNLTPKPVLLLKRIGNIWQQKDTLYFAGGPFGGSGEKLARYYKNALLGLWVIALVLAGRRREIWIVSGLFLAYFIPRLVSLVANAGLESRYLVPSYPVLEITVLYAVFWAVRRVGDSSRPHGTVAG